MSDFFPTLPPDAQPASTISFNFADVDPPKNIDFAVIENWIKQVIRHHQATLGQLSYIFCSDAYLHQLNVDYLDHDTLTDIITFPYAEPPYIDGDLYISTERVADNAHDRSLPFTTELQRVIIHGVLHLCGYGDKTPEEAIKMRQLEEAALARLK